MYILKNAIKNLGRNAGRNIFLGIIMLCIITISCVSLIINNAAQGIKEDYKKTYGSEVFINADQEKMNQLMAENQDGMSFPTLPQIPEKTIQKLAKSKHVKSAQFKTFLSAYSDSLDPIKSKDSENGMNGGIVSSGGIGIEEMKETEFTIYGFSDLSLEEKIKSKKRNLAEGSYPKAKDECIISKELAELNNLNVGDTIKVKNTISKNAKGEELKELSLKISGLYTLEKEKTPAGYMIINAAENDIFMYYELLNDPNYAYEAYTDTTFYLNNPDELEAFQKEAKEAGLPDIYNVTTDENAYNQAIGPIEKMGDLAFMFLCVIIVLGALIILLLSMLAIRERKYEIGVLRAMGMKKLQVSRGMLYESLCIMIIALVLGTGLGTIFAQPTADKILSDQLEKAKESNQGGTFSMSVTSGSSITKPEVKEVSTSLQPETILQLSFIAILLVIVANSISTVYITKYEPMQILSDRN